MSAFICSTCGAQYPESDTPPAVCPICADERQYVRHGGQQWTTPDALRAQHRNEMRAEGPGLTGIGTLPRFAIGQRALLVETRAGNLLWDCNSLIDDETEAAIRARGGLQLIALSHPHFQSASVAWAKRFGVDVFVHEDDAQHIMRPDPLIKFWHGETLELSAGATLIRCGGHFTGSQVLHWADGEGGSGALLTGDTIDVQEDRRYVSFMRSYPNLIPLSIAAVRHIADAIEPFEFTRIYGGWWGMLSAGDAKDVMRRSVARYIAAIRGE
jgi:hypothetical protein